MLLRARIVLPIAAPPIEDGAVLVSGEHIAAVGPWRELSSQVSAPIEDLGEVALLPGLVNAHCHLDYTGFAGHLPQPRSFTDWIKGVLALKAGWSFSEYAASWISGAHQLLASGCTTVFDIEAVPELLPEVWSDTPMRVVSALELTGVRSSRSVDEIVAAAEDRAAHLPANPRKRVALSPHAPYSTRTELLALAAAAARRHGWPLTMHVAESVEEFDMFRHARGAMHAWLRGQRGETDCGHRTPLAHVAAAGLLGPDCTVVHANCLEDQDVVLLAGSGAHVAHCPRSHRYFDHPPFPFDALRRAGVNVCLGTDSLLSVIQHGTQRPRLDLFAELAQFAEANPGVPPRDILALLTVNAARALGCTGEIGELRPGAAADLVAIPTRAGAADVCEAVVRYSGPVAAVMIAGRWETARLTSDAQTAPRRTPCPP